MRTATRLAVLALWTCLPQPAEARPTLEHERKPNATRNGRHTDNLLRDVERGPIDPLVRIMRSAVANYLNALPVREKLIAQRDLIMFTGTYSMLEINEFL